MGSGTWRSGPISVVLGASGYTGRALVEQLAQGQWSRDAKVVALLRPGSPSTAALEVRFADLGAECLRSELEEAELAALLQATAPSHLFLVHGTTRRRARDEGLEGDPYETVDLGVTRTALAAAGTLETPPRVVYLSSQGTGGRAPGAYLRARALAEEAVRSSGLPWTIARAPLITGTDRSERRPLEAAGGAALGLVAHALRRVGAVHRAAHIAPTDAKELAYGLAHAAFNYTTIGRVLEAEELRYEQPLARMGPIPETRRDDPRH